MSTDNYTGNSFTDLNVNTPDDSDSIGVVGAALRQIKRALKTPEGLSQFLADIITSDDPDNPFKEALNKLTNTYVVGDVYQTQSDRNPNDYPEIFGGKWEEITDSVLVSKGTQFQNVGYWYQTHISRDDALIAYEEKDVYLGHVYRRWYSSGMMEIWGWHWDWNVNDNGSSDFARDLGWAYLDNFYTLVATYEKAGENWWHSDNKNVIAVQEKGVSWFKLSSKDSTENRDYIKTPKKAWFFTRGYTSEVPSDYVSQLSWKYNMRVIHTWIKTSMTAD